MMLTAGTYREVASLHLLRVRVWVRRHRVRGRHPIPRCGQGYPLACEDVPIPGGRAMSTNLKAWLTEISVAKSHLAASLDAGSVHRWLTLAADSNRFLWVSPRAGLLIVQSERPLDRTALGRGIDTLFAAERALTFPQDARVELTGIVAPTKAEFQRGRRGKIRALPAEDVPAWILRRLGSAVSIDGSLSIEALSPAQGRKKDGTRTLTTRTSFHTYATVTNSERLAELLLTGVGRGKRYGAGLILAKEVA